MLILPSLDQSSIVIDDVLDALHSLLLVLVLSDAMRKKEHHSTDR